MNQMLTDIEKNIAERQDTDRRMWFSMWILLSFVTFGAAWFLMIYYLIKRRNEHFERQKKLEALVLKGLRQLSREKPSEPESGVQSLSDNKNPNDSRNAVVWTVSTILILPTFYVLRFLMDDLVKHEEHEAAFLQEIVSFAKSMRLSMTMNDVAIAAKSVTLKRYLVLTAGSIGLTSFYWLYRIFNDYNRHFKRQWRLEDELLRALKSAET